MAITNDSENILPYERIVLYSPYGQTKTAREYRAPHRNDIRPIGRSGRAKRKQSQHESTRVRSARKNRRLVGNGAGTCHTASGKKHTRGHHLRRRTGRTLSGAEQKNRTCAHRSENCGSGADRKKAASDKADKSFARTPLEDKKTARGH